MARATESSYFVAMRFLVPVALVAVASGCSGGSFELAEQPGSDAGDASVPIDAATDARDDTAPILDASPDARPDAPGPDAPGPDANMDTGPSDVGPVCPAPTTTASFDASIYSCGVLPEMYAHHMKQAKRCSCDADCRERVAKDFCGCGTFVNPGQDAYAALKAMRKQWEASGCSIACPAIPCAEPLGAKCVPTVEGKQCTDGA